jgi:hypothetical protein
MKIIIISLILFITLLQAAPKFNYAKVEINGPQDIQFFKDNKIDVDREMVGFDKNKVLQVYVTQEQFALISQKGWKTSWIIDNRTPVEKATSYHTYATLTTELQNLQSSY